jgi:hypothetical protein
MLIVDGQIHLWQRGTLLIPAMSPGHSEIMSLAVPT